MKKPNLFIIGAPKCGTTSIAAWLSEHPQVFMCRPKEPHHFNTDSRRSVTKRSEYERLFRGATEQHVAIGEASVWYLESRTAVTAIEEYADSPKYVVCLRNPVEMAPSLHQQQLFTGNEHIRDFHTAWNLSDARLKGRHIARNCWEDPRHLAYKHMGHLGEQVHRLTSLVPKERLHFILLDDIRTAPQMAYTQLLMFIGADGDGRSTFPILNSAKARRSRLIHAATRLAGLFKRQIGQGRFPSCGILGRINQWNAKPHPRAQPTEQLLVEMKRHYALDITLLSRLIMRDLTCWLS